MTMQTPMLFDEQNLLQSTKDKVHLLSTEQIVTMFLEFWKIYPRRLGGNPKAEAERKFVKAVHSGSNSETIIDGARRFAAECLRNRTEARFVPMAVTWLNQKRWRDDPDAGPDAEPKSFIDIARDLREYARANPNTENADPD